MIFAVSRSQGKNDVRLFDALKYIYSKQHFYLNTLTNVRAEFEISVHYHSSVGSLIFPEAFNSFCGVLYINFESLMCFQILA